jgi:hypothetical protein
VIEAAPKVIFGRKKGGKKCEMEPWYLPPYCFTGKYAGLNL